MSRLILVVLLGLGCARVQHVSLAPSNAGCVRACREQRLDCAGLDTARYFGSCVKPFSTCLGSCIGKEAGTFSSESTDRALDGMVAEWAPLGCEPSAELYLVRCLADTDAGNLQRYSDAAAAAIFTGRTITPLTENPGNCASIYQVRIDRCSRVQAARGAAAAATPAQHPQPIERVGRTPLIPKPAEK